jgi:hypothetical protein
MQLNQVKGMEEKVEATNFILAASAASAAAGAVAVLSASLYFCRE